MAKKKKKGGGSNFDKLPRNAQKAFFAKLKSRGKVLGGLLRDIGLPLVGAFAGARIGLRAGGGASRLGLRAVGGTSRRFFDSSVTNVEFLGSVSGAIAGAIFGSNLAEGLRNRKTPPTQSQMAKLSALVVKEAESGRPSSRRIRREAKKIEAAGGGRFMPNDINRAVRASHELSRSNKSMTRLKERSSRKIRRRKKS